MKPAEFLALSDRFREALEKRCEDENKFYKYMGALHPLQPQRLYFIVGDEVWSLYNDGNTAQYQYEGIVDKTNFGKDAGGDRG